MAQGPDAKWTAMLTTQADRARCSGGFRSSQSSTRETTEHPLHLNREFDSKRALIPVSKASVAISKSLYYSVGILCIRYTPTKSKTFFIFFFSVAQRFCLSQG